jgi:hypothetical protein
MVATMYDLIPLDVPDGFADPVFMIAAGLNQRGDITATVQSIYSDFNSYEYGFRITDTSVENLGAYGFPLAQNNVGDLVYYNFGPLWRAANGVVTPLTPKLGGNTLGPAALSDDGLLVGLMSTIPLTEPELWPEDLGTLPWGAFAYDLYADAWIVSPDEWVEAFGDRAPVAVNNSRDILLNEWRGDPNLPGRAAVFRVGTLIPLGEELVGTAINDARQVVGYRRSPLGDEAFLCNTADGVPELQFLGSLPSFPSSRARAINNRGEIVGTSGSHCFYRSPEGPMQDLGGLLNGGSGAWTSWHPVAINDKGNILTTACDGTTIRACLLRQHADILFDATQYIGRLYSLVWGSAGVWFGPGTKPTPIDPPPDWLDADKRDMVLGVLLSELGASLGDEETRRLMDAAALRLARAGLERWTARDRIQTAS